MGLKNELRNLALSNEMDYFGVGSVNRWANAPVGHRPNDLLPEAKSVIVLGIRIPKGAIEGNRRAYEGLRHGIFTYMLYGYNKLNERLDLAAVKIARFLDNAGYKSFLLPASVPRDEYLMMGEMSNRHAAVCAGLADFGWHGLAMTPEAGPRVRWVPIITELELEADPMYSGDPLCDHNQCSVCVSACPVQALSEDHAVNLIIADREFSYGLLNRPLCRCGVTGLAVGTAGRLQASIPPGLNTVEEWRRIAGRDDAWNRKERVAAMCGRCLVLCPAGRE